MASTANTARKYPAVKQVIRSPPVRVAGSRAADPDPRAPGDHRDAGRADAAGPDHPDRRRARPPAVSFINGIKHLPREFG
jgi:hypothetical protein